MIQFNTEQQRAVGHVNGPMLVLAGPGSGKTAVLTGRVLRLIKDEGIDPYNILVLTFSRAAASEMQSRFNALAGETYPVSFGTFHAIFYHILKRQGLYRTGEILNHKKKTELLKKAAMRAGVRHKKDMLWSDRMLSLISLKKMNCGRELSIMTQDEEDDLTKIFEPYVALCRTEDLLDFDDMINECLKALKGNDRILKKWQERYRYILVDEFQDIDPRQYEILTLLAGKNGNVFCVGDDDQSIYSFRGAEPSLMRQFTEEYRDISIVTLRNNYRCPGEVIEHAQQLISKNRDRFDKKQICDSECGRCIEYKCFRTAYEEAGYCVDTVKRILDLACRDKDAHASVGILYRISQGADAIEDALRSAGISCRRHDRHESFYGREWLKDITAYLKLSLNYDRNALLRILNRPERGLLRESVSSDMTDRTRMLAYYEGDQNTKEKCEELLRNIDFIGGLNCFAALNFILHGIGMYDYIREKYFESSTDEEYEETINDLRDRARGFATVSEWLKHIERSERLNTYNTDDADAQVELMTVHASKGLEFDNVIITGLQEGVFPGKRCETAEDIEEERRLFYVAMTRCRKRLWVLGRRRDDYGKRESRFIAEAGFRNETVGSILDSVI